MQSLSRKILQTKDCCRNGGCGCGRSRGKHDGIGPGRGRVADRETCDLAAVVDGVIRWRDSGCGSADGDGGAVYVKEILGDSFIYDKNLNLDGLNIIVNKNIKKE